MTETRLDLSIKHMNCVFLILHIILTQITQIALFHSPIYLQVNTKKCHTITVGNLDINHSIDSKSDVMTLKAAFHTTPRYGEPTKGATTTTMEKSLGASKSNSKMTKETSTKMNLITVEHRLPKRKGTKSKKKISIVNGTSDEKKDSKTKMIKTKIVTNDTVANSTTPIHVKNVSSDDIDKDASNTITHDNTITNTTNPPKMSPRSKTRHKRTLLSTNSITETSSFPTIMDDSACFGSQAIILDATSEESEMNLLLPVEQGIWKNIDRVVEDNTVPSLMSWFQRQRGCFLDSNSHHREIVPQDSIFDGLESVHPPDQQMYHAMSTSPRFCDVLCGGDPVLIRDSDGELHIRNVASMNSAKDGVIMEISSLCESLSDTEGESEEVDTIEDVDRDASFDETEDEYEEGDGESLLFDVYTPVSRGDRYESEEEEGEYETGTETEESDLDEIMDEEECCSESGTEFDSVSATTSSSTSLSLEGSEEEEDDELSETMGSFAPRERRTNRSIPTRLCPTPSAVQSPISIREYSTSDSESKYESSSSSRERSSTPVNAMSRDLHAGTETFEPPSPGTGRKTPSSMKAFSSFMKRAMTTPKANKMNQDTAVLHLEKKSLDEVEKRDIISTVDNTVDVPAQVQCAMLNEDNNGMGVDSKPASLSGKVDDFSNEDREDCVDNDSNLALVTFGAVGTTVPPELASFIPTPNEEVSGNSNNDSVNTPPADTSMLLPTPSSLSNKDKPDESGYNTATTIEETSEEGSGSIIASQISLEEHGIEVSFSSRSDKESFEDTSSEVLFMMNEGKEDGLTIEHNRSNVSSRRSREESQTLLPQEQLEEAPSASMQEESPEVILDTPEIDESHEVGIEMDLEIVDRISGSKSSENQNVESADKDEFKNFLPSTQNDKSSLEESVLEPSVADITPEVMLDDTAPKKDNDANSDEPQPESREDTMLSDTSDEPCRENTSDDPREDEEITNNESKSDSSNSKKVANNDEAFTREESCSTSSLDRSTSAWSRMSEALSTSSEAIEIKSPKRIMKHLRRRVGKRIQTSRRNHISVDNE